MTQFIFFNLYKTTSAQYLFVDFQFSFLVIKNNNNINNDDDNNNNNCNNNYMHGTFAT